MKQIFRNKWFWIGTVAALLVIALVVTLLVIAPWKQRFTVSFESSGGGSFASVKVKEGDSLPLDQLPSPMKVGQRFRGWYTDPEATVAYASEPIDGDLTLYAGYITPDDLVADELTQMLIGDVEQDFAITVTSTTPLTNENLDDHVALVVDYGSHEDGTEINLSVEDAGGGIYRLTANYAKPGRYQLVLLTPDVTFNTDDEVVQKRGITTAARLLVYTVPGESFSNVVYKEAVKELDPGRILAYNEKAVCITGNGAYQTGDIISLPAGDNSNYYTIQKTISVQEAKNAGLEIPSDVGDAICYAIKLSELSEIFDDMEGYLRSELSAEDFLFSEVELEAEIARDLEGNAQLNQLSNLMIAGAEATEEYKTLSVQKLGTVAQVVPLARQTQAGVWVDVKLNQRNPEYFSDMYNFSSNSKFHMVEITVDKEVEVTNASGKGLTVSAEITFAFGIHIHIDADANYYVFYADYDASLTTLTHTSVEFNLSVKTTDSTGYVNLNGAFEDLLEQAEEDIRKTPDAFFEMYDQIMGDGSSDRLTLVSERIARPSYTVGVIEISFPVDLKLSVDLHAAFNAKVEIKTGNMVGIRGDTWDGYSTYSYHENPSIRFSMMIQGHADIRAGIQLSAQINFAGLECLGYISLSAEVGPYVDLYGYYYLDLYRKGGVSSMSTAGAYYMGVGIYLDVDANAKVLSKKFSANLYDKQWEFLRFGNKETLHSLSTTISEPLRLENDGLDLNDPEIRNAIKLKFYDITEAASSKNPYAKEINFDDFHICPSYQFYYDQENKKVYFSGTANTDTKEGTLFLYYRYTSGSMFNTLSLQIPIQYWNDGLLGDYDPAKADEVYTITYTFEGRVLKTQQVPYGTRLTGSGQWDSECVAGNDDIIYGRVKWDHGNPIVVSDMTFEGVGELANCRDYLYILKDDQYYTRMHLSAPYGQVPDVSAYTDTNEGHTFTHWHTGCADRPVEITANLSKSTPVTYIAHYVKRSQATLTFDPGDGVLFDNLHVQQESNAFKVYFDDHNGSDIFLNYHAVPKDPNLKFVGFALNGKIYKEGDRITVKPDQEYHLTAVYENKSTAITFVDSGETFIAYREPGETLSIPLHKDNTQTFLGWESAADGFFYADMSDYFVSGEDTLTAVYDASTKVHTVTYDLAGGRLPDGRTEVILKVTNGKYAPDIGIPILEKDGKIYTFTGWSPELGPVTQDTTYTAIYAEVKTYTVTYDLAGGKLADGRTSVTVQVAEGEYAPEIGTPTLKKNDGKTYAFVEWSPEMTPITKDTTYTAVYEEVTTVTPPVLTGVHHKIENGVLTIYGQGSMKDYYGDSTKNRSWDNDSSIKKIVVEDGILSIGAYAFWNMPSVTEVQIAESVGNIGIGAFAECGKLQKINLPSKLTQLGGSALCGTAITSLTFPAGIKTVPDDVAAMCTKLTRVTFASGTTKIGSRAFQQCTALTSVTLPSTLKELGEMAFEETAITSITIPSGVTKIGSSTFYGCTKLSSVSLHNGITTIDDYAFRSCTALRSIALPAKLKTIGTGAFSESGLVSVTIPEGVSTLPMDAFSACENLVSVTIPKSVTTIEMGAFYGCPKLTEVAVPSGCEVGTMAFDDGVSITYYE